MPELPDLTVYVEALAARLQGRVLQGIRLGNPFVLRTVEPRLDAFTGLPVVEIRRVGKRLCLGVPGDLWLVIHLMIAGRLHWKPAGAAIPKKYGLLAIDTAEGTVLLTEAGTQRRASLHAVRGQAALSAHDRGGIEPLTCTLVEFQAVLRRERHTIKRALTDPRLLAGIGNAYSDEILHRARLSPLQRTDQLEDLEIARLFQAMQAVLVEWTERLRREAGGDFPQKVTAFRPEMAVHGKFGRPCPDCGSPVQRIVYADNETNYCAKCQTGGRLLADRALSRLLKDDWPKSLEELGET